MHLLLCLWFFVAHYNIVLMSEHIAGVDNCTADRLSRYNMHSFFSINPQASPIPTSVSPLLLQLLTPSGADSRHQPPSSSCFFLLSKRPSHLHYKTLSCWSTKVHPASSQSHKNMSMTPLFTYLTRMWWLTAAETQRSFTFI